MLEKPLRKPAPARQLERLFAALLEIFLFKKGLSVGTVKVKKSISCGIRIGELDPLVLQLAILCLLAAILAFCRSPLSGMCFWYQKFTV